MWMSRRNFIVPAQLKAMAKGKIKASHILVDRHRQAMEIYELLLGNRDFANLAQIHSTDRGSGKRGGNLGEFGRGKMVKEFEKVAFNLKVGEISKPVKTQFGYHIIKRTK
ncbi:MAG: peptidyl-prolyl cis-trans isomerase [Candidatus Heimdallarchaeota archaeon]|nr:peptidyl-prolyl cis-trans isomerase [Candidatus Heimdallarchaeota archaeon]